MIKIWNLHSFFEDFCANFYKILKFLSFKIFIENLKIFMINSVNKFYQKCYIIVIYLFVVS